MATHPQIAAFYAARGWPVFPLQPGGKKPRIPRAHPPGHPCRGECGQLGHGLYDATVDVDKVGAWWSQWPTANIGLRTGVVFDVLDVDGPEGVAELDRLFNERPFAGENRTDDVLVGPTVTSRPGGSYCHFYCQPTGRGNRTRFAPGLDWRGQGGYVVAAGSTRPPSGWQWYHGAADQLYGVDAEIHPAPAWLLDVLAAATDQPPAPAADTASRWLNNRAGSRGERYAAAAIEKSGQRMAGATEGNRNNTLLKEARGLGRVLRDHHNRDLLTEAINVLYRAAIQTGLGHAETTATITSGMAQAGIIIEKRAA